jgi:hypothetical protein
MTESSPATNSAEQWPGVIVSVGADIDAAVLEDEIRAEVARKERAGIYPPELLLGVVPDSLRDRMDALAGAADLSLDPPVHSTRPGLGRLVAGLKRVVARTMRWHTRWLVGQVQTLGGSTVAAMSAMTERLDHLQEQLGHLSADLDRLHATRLDGTRASMPAPFRAAAVSDAANLRELTLRPAGGRIACLCCGDGRFLETLADTGASCYGVEPDSLSARSCADRGLEVLTGDVLEHLAGLPEESLAGIVVESGERLGAPAMHELFGLAAAALLPGAPLVIEVAPGQGADGDRLLGLPFEFLAEETGFHTVRVSRPPPVERRGSSVPAPAEAGPDQAVDAMCTRLATLEAAVFGASAARVVARR